MEGFTDPGEVRPRGIGRNTSVYGEAVWYDGGEGMCSCVGARCCCVCCDASWREGGLAVSLSDKHTWTLI
jgi:hypothetical protein